MANPISHRTPMTYSDRMSAEPLRLLVLGTPRIAPQGTERPRSRLAWALLASLAVDPMTAHREQLADRFWPGQRNGRKSLRQALFSLRQTLGADRLDEDRESVRLRPGALNTDLNDLWHALAQDTAPGTAAARAAALTDAAALLRGPFLDGIDDPQGPTGWITRERTRCQHLTADLLMRLALSLEAVGNLRGAFESASRALQVDPEHPGVSQIVWRLGQASGQERLTRARLHELSLEALTAEQAQGNRLTPMEADSFGTLVEARLARLSDVLRRALSSLAVFPAPFTAEQALQIAGVVVHELDPLVTAGVLRRDAERWDFVAGIRSVLWKRLTGEQRRRLRERHRRFFVEFIRPSRAVEQIQAECGHFQAAVESIVDLPPTTADHVELAELLGVYINRCPSNPDTVRSVIPYMEFLTTHADTTIASSAASTRSRWELQVGNPMAAVHWAYCAFQLSRDLKDLANYLSSIENLLALTHHQGDDDGFDSAVQIAVQAAQDPAFPFPEAKSRSGFTERVYRILTENALARRRLDEALHWSDRCLALRETTMDPIDDEAHTWFLRGQILSHRQRVEEARQAWNRAMHGFRRQGDTHGVADCLQELGMLLARGGDDALGLSLLQQAISLFETCGDTAAVHAARGDQGDILCAAGDPQAARALYEAGLAFWAEQGHPRWTARFRERLDRLAA
jgi:DNA-binding SARP family transcriptional activator